MSDKPTVKQVARRYSVMTLVLMGLFGVLILASMVLAPQPGPGLAAILTLVCAAPLLGWAYEFQRLVRGLDELQGRLVLQASAIAGGSVLIGATIWALAERFGLLPPLDYVLLLPVAAGLQGVVIALQDRYFA